MHMVRHAARPITFTARVARDRSKVGVKLGPNVEIKERTTILGAKNNMNDDTAKRLRHGSNYGPKAQFISAWGNVPCEATPHVVMRRTQPHQRQRRDSFVHVGSGFGDWCMTVGGLERAFSPWGG